MWRVWVSKVWPVCSKVWRVWVSKVWPVCSKVWRVWVSKVWPVCSKVWRVCMCGGCGSVDNAHIVSNLGQNEKENS